MSAGIVATARSSNMESGMLCAGILKCAWISASAPSVFLDSMAARKIEPALARSLRLWMARSSPASELRVSVPSALIAARSWASVFPS